VAVTQSNTYLRLPLALDFSADGTTLFAATYTTINDPDGSLYGAVSVDNTLAGFALSSSNTVVTRTLMSGPPEGVALGVAVAANNVIYVSEYATNSILRFSATNFDKSSASYFVTSNCNGGSTANTISQPGGLVFDASGNLLVFNQGSGGAPIVLITPAASCINYITAGVLSSSNAPRYGAFDASNTLFVSTLNGIYRVTPPAVSIYFAVTALSNGNYDMDLAGLVFDVNGNILVSYTSFSLPHVPGHEPIDQGVLLLSGGSGGWNGVATLLSGTAAVGFPTALAIDAAGYLYVGDRDTGVVWTFPTGGAPCVSQTPSPTPSLTASGTAISHSPTAMSTASPSQQPCAYDAAVYADFTTYFGFTQFLFPYTFPGAIAVGPASTSMLNGGPGVVFVVLHDEAMEHAQVCVVPDPVLAC
jgi:hypothetical protein